MNLQKQVDDKCANLDVDQIELKHRVTYLEHKRKNSRSRSKNNADPNSGPHEGYYPVTVQTVPI